SQILVSGHPGESGDVQKTRTYLYPVDLIRFTGFFDTHSFLGLNRGPHGSLRKWSPCHDTHY
ncbi:hypothetical protein, partial [Salmonella enterica]|uniref:hypothetical protein n=1 Tax=Salmonella enterica TaxID=28901 RepID=UPI00344DDAF8